MGKGLHYLAASAITLALALGSSGPALADGPGSTARVFATREGLVGGVTANGHQIVERDWFAALPSRLGLSGKGTGERSVSACVEAPVHRCVFVPVWDVGPWNTRDDYWNADRQMWTDLPVGTPQAQAAYLDGYNGGRDEFGRLVGNPAGIDLADGAFWDGLGLTDNAWVLVTFLWKTGGARGEVRTGGGQLRVRSGPNTAAEVRGGAGDHAHVPVLCQQRGEQISGPVRSTDLWNQVAGGLYLSHAYVAVPDGWSVPACTGVTG